MMISSQISADQRVGSHAGPDQPAAGSGDAAPADEPLTIRQMCDSHDVTPRALRFYEARGLLSPHRVGQQRLYSRRDRVRLHLILQGKRFGFSLDQIGHLLELYDPSSDNLAQIAATLAAARARLADMRRQARELASAIEELAARITAAEAAYPHLAPEAETDPA